MLTRRALAELTRPGPIEAGTHDLVAVAGEGMKLSGFVEVSAVCTHPDCHGGGYAAQLTSTVKSQMLARGEAAFLYASSTPAIALYKALGFAVRREMIVTVLAETASQIRDPEPRTLRAAQGMEPPSSGLLRR